MAVDHKVVEGIFRSYQLRFDTSPQLLQNELAFRAIKDFRNTGGSSTDESLAAAEHYLFSRYMVSNAIVSKAQMDSMVVGYSSLKALAQLNSRLEMAMRHNKARATSKVSSSSVAWGLVGSIDGEKDRVLHAPASAPPSWNWDAMKFGGATDAVATAGKKAY
jgi:hypothetical protein